MAQLQLAVASADQGRVRAKTSTTATGQLEVDTTVLGSQLVSLPASGETVLVVEDQSSIRDLLRLQLTGHGYTVLTAADGAEGLAAILAHGEIGVVVSDIVMPSMRGTEMIEVARRHRPDLRAVFISGYSDQVFSNGWQKRQDDLLLNKPFTSRELQWAVRAALTGRVPKPPEFGLNPGP